MVAYKNKETLSRRYSIGRNTSRRIAYVLGVCLYCAASTAAAVDSETWHYGLDNVGNITSRGTDSQNPTHNYGYDGVYRLTDETNPSNTDQYSYDSNSNRTSFTRDGTSTSYQIDSNSNRITQVGSDPRTYDNIGNTKTDRNGTRTFTYNQAGRLVQVHENSQLLATYTYNAYGQRTIKTTPSGTTYYLYAPDGKLLGEYDDTGQPIKEYAHLADEPIAQLETSKITYLHSDHLATPRKATNETGNVVWKWDSEAFGNKPPESSGTTVNLRFPGQYYDSETGLYYNYFRYYNPSAGRYIQSDPLGLYDSPNLYTYVYNNPLIYTDPTGEFGLIGAGIGAGMSLLSQLAANGGNWNCVKWGQVAVSAGLGAVGGGLANGLVKGAFRFKSVGSNTWRATKHWGRSRNIKAMQVRNGQHRHHWLFQRNQGWGQNVSNRIKNQPWNVHPVSPSFNGWMARGNTNLRSLLGAPPWARGVVGGTVLAGGGATANALGGGSNCECQ